MNDLKIYKSIQQDALKKEYQKPEILSAELLEIVAGTGCGDAGGKTTPGGTCGVFGVQNS